MLQQDQSLKKLMPSGRGSILYNSLGMKYPEGKSTNESRSVVAWNSDWEQGLTINRHGSGKEGSTLTCWGDEDV